MVRVFVPLLLTGEWGDVLRGPFCVVFPFFCNRLRICNYIIGILYRSLCIILNISLTRFLLIKLNFRHSLDICVEGLRKITMKFKKDGWSPCRDWNSMSLEYKIGVLHTWPWQLTCNCCDAYFVSCLVVLCLRTLVTISLHPTEIYELQNLFYSLIVVLSV
jgi:hypothetical protein